MVNKVATSLTIFYLPRGSGTLDSNALNLYFSFSTSGRLGELAEHNNQR